MFSISRPWLFQRDAPLVQSEVRRSYLGHKQRRLWEEYKSGIGIATLFTPSSPLQPSFPGILHFCQPFQHSQGLSLSMSVFDNGLPTTIFLILWSQKCFNMGTIYNQFVCVENDVLKTSRRLYSTQWGQCSGSSEKMKARQGQNCKEWKQFKFSAMFYEQ